MGSEAKTKGGPKLFTVSKECGPMHCMRSVGFGEQCEKETFTVQLTEEELQKLNAVLSGQITDNGILKPLGIAFLAQYGMGFPLCENHHW